MLVCTWVLCLAPQAFQSWEKASLFPETYTWDEPNHHELAGRGPTTDSECVCACKSAGEDVGSHHLESFCAAVQASWNTSLESRHHCNVCSRCLLVPCPRSHRAWQAWIPLPAARAKIRPRRRMVPPRLPLQMFFSSRIVASSCFRRQPRVSLKRYSNRLQRLKLHTSPKQTSTWKSLSNTIRYNRAQGKGGPTFGPHLLHEAAVNESSCLKELRQRLLRATRQGPAWYERNRHCSWVPCLAPHRGLEVCHKGTHRSRRSAHPCSSVIVSKRIMHPWEGTIRQQIASYVDHQRRTARLARGCTAYASQIAPCRSAMIQVRTVHACSYHPSSDPWHAMSSAEAAQAMSKELQRLGPDAGPNEDSTQDGEAARTRVPRSRYRPDGSRRRTQEELQQRRKAKQKGTGFWATPQGRRIAASREREPVQNRSQTWQDRDGVWHNWNTSEASASTSARARTSRTKQGRLLAPTSSQDWSQLRCREGSGPRSTSPGESGKPSGPYKKPGPD